jgi:hypothetical protein
VGKRFVDVFIRQDCYYRSIVIDWALWKGKYFGGAFESDALKKRRAYKKWAELLLHPELKDPIGRDSITTPSSILIVSGFCQDTIF